jgi:competence protein ComEC
MRSAGSKVNWYTPSERCFVGPPEGRSFLFDTLLFMQARLFYGALVSLAVGIGVQTVFPVSLVEIVWVLFLGLVLAVVWRRNSFAVSAPHLLLVSVIFISFSLGLLRLEVASWQFDISPLQEQLGNAVVLTGIVVSEQEERLRTIQFFIKTETDKILVSTDRLVPVAYGDEVIVSGKLERPESFTTEFGREFDYVGYLKARGVEYRVSFAEVEVAGSGKGNLMLERLLVAKQAFLSSLSRVVPEPANGLGAGLLLGVKSALGDDIEENFRRTGIIHIVVLSGYNVMLVVAFILFCLSYVLSLRSRLVVSVVAIVCFALMVGLSATVVRASVMASLLLLSQFLGRGYNVLRALIFAGVIMLMINPYLLIYDIGFQLSFMATLGLVLLLPSFEATVMDEKKRVGVREFFLSTVATQIAVLPLLLYHIGQVSLIAVVVNVLVLPIVPLAMLLTFATGIIAMISVTVASVVGYMANLSLNYILLVADCFADIPFAAVEIPPLSGWSVFVLYGVMLIAWWGGKWYLDKKKNPKELAGWTVVEEDGEMADIGAGLRPAPMSANSKSDLPIFFR